MTQAASETGPSRADALPLVSSEGGNRGLWLFAGGLALVAIALFYTLEARRASIAVPAIGEPREASGGTIASPPQLVIPSGSGNEFPERNYIGPYSRYSQPRLVERTELQEPQRLVRRVPSETTTEAPSAEAPQRLTTVDTRDDPRPVIRRPRSEAPDPVFEDPERKRLYLLANPGWTIPKGTVIHAVLETALDSTRPGGARAIVSRDVSSYDGTRILIPKGSRLLGEYEADLARGQKRALIQWSRLMLPGGVIMEIDSPSADTLGRAGVKGKVNSHFFARFGGAILQSVLDLGVRVASREAGGDTVILNAPNATQIQTNGDEISPTLTVRHGSSVSVFVAHDLDFSDVAAS